MFRRPAPGRPARQCGHPKAAQCDCLAKRTLCCVLSHEQWDFVEQGQIVQVAMYDSREDLDAAQHSNSISAQSTPPSFLDSASTPLTTTSTPMAHEPYLSTSTPVPVSQLQMFATGASPTDSKPVVDSFGFYGNGSQLPMHDMAAQYQAPQANVFIPQPSAPYQPFYRSYDHQSSGSMHTDMQRGSISQQSPPQTLWPQPRPEYMPYDQPHFVPPPQDPQLEALKLERMHLSPDLQALQQFTPSSHISQFSPSALPSIYQPLPMPTMHDFTLDSDIPMQIDFDPAQPPSPIQEVTQSCCSSKRTQPHPSQSLPEWRYPPSAPTQQFPCPRCASTMCTCTNCPEVMQNPLLDGAWARACGRSGHLDADQYIIPQVVPQRQVPQQPRPQAAAPTPSASRSSCCSGNSGISTAQGSPFSQPAHNGGQWAAPVQQEREAQPHQGLLYDANGMIIDQTLMYNPNDWQNMR